MRKKSGRSNYRNSKSFLGSRSLPSADDGEGWITLEADLTDPVARPPLARRSLVWTIRILGLACLVGSGWMGAKWAHQKIFVQNDGFVLKQLEIKTDGTLEESTLAQVANVAPGLALMDLDLEQIRVRLEKLPSVEEVVVSREMPDRLTVLVKERMPIAWLSCPPLGIRRGDLTRGFLIDSEGYLFRCLSLDEGIMSLPVIEAFKMDEPEEGVQLSSEEFRAALSLVADERVYPGESDMEVVAVRIRNEWSIQASYRSGLQAVFSLHDLERGLADLKTILRDAGSLESEIAMVNVVARDNIPIQFSRELGPDEIFGKSSGTESLEKAEEVAPASPQEKHLRSILKGG